MTKFTEFLSNDAGAVTIDWVALTAGVLMLGLVTVYSIFNNGVAPLASEINSTLTGMSVEVPSAAISPI